MRKVFRLLIFAAVVFVSCSNKTHPSVSSSNNQLAIPSTKYPESKSDTATFAGAATPSPVIAAKTYASPMIIIDEKGSIITSRDNLPDEIASKVNYKQIARSFTPAQRTNLIYRFKMVPPRVLFIPADRVQHSAKGYYCIYKKKFWYWQKDDGLFYLDEKYYR